MVVHAPGSITDSWLPFQQICGLKTSKFLH